RRLGVLHRPLRGGGGHPRGDRRLPVASRAPPAPDRGRAAAHGRSIPLPVRPGDAHGNGLGTGVPPAREGGAPVKWAGLAAGALRALLGGGRLWATALVDPPESVSRRLALLSSLYPESSRGAEVERIPCRPLRHLRLYVVCTGGCEETWVIVGVRGLWPENL